MDVGESESGPLDPNSLANHIEDAFDLVGGLVEIEESTSERVRALIGALREMPTDLPFIDEESTEEEIMEHPVVDYKVRILDGGTEAITRVVIESSDSKNQSWFTVGISPNIVEASFEALMDSINYKLIKSDIK